MPGILKKIFFGAMPLGFLMSVILSAVAVTGGGVAANSVGTANGAGQAVGITQECEAYRPIVERVAKRFGMENYVELILAVMMQESAGRLPDVMQAAEGAYNTRYPRVPNGIPDPEYSIECGIQELKHALEMAGCKGPADLDAIKLALQGYNYGPGYITWAINNHGGYSPENAAAFSDMMAIKMGWSAYGDKLYVEHVLRYYKIVYTGSNDIAAGDASDLIKEAGKYMGMPYVYGGSSPSTSFDCSGFIYYVYNQCGYQVPRLTAQGFYDRSVKINPAEAQPGDLCFFEHTYNFYERITHIGMYIGNGQMMHFGNPGKVSPVSSFGNKFVGFGRLPKPGN